MKKLSTLLLTIMTCISFANAEVYNGTCGANLSWSLNTEDSTLIISGSGQMSGWWSSQKTPWEDYNSYVKYVTLPDGLVNIGYRAFNHSSVVSISIPNTVTSIDGYAFQACQGLRSITIPNSVTYIALYAFLDCWALTSINIPSSVIRLGEGAFCACKLLSSVTLNNGVERIFQNAFASCTYLKSIKFPSSIRSIDTNAFAGCKLQSITCEAANPPVLGPDAFYKVDKSIPVYVPALSITLYKNEYQWKEFTNILPISDSPQSLDQITNDQSSITNKVLRNGQLLILRGDNTYTIDGREVK